MYFGTMCTVHGGASKGDPKFMDIELLAAILPMNE